MTAAPPPGWVSVRLRRRSCAGAQSHSSAHPAPPAWLLSASRQGQLRARMRGGGGGPGKQPGVRGTLLATAAAMARAGLEPDGIGQLQAGCEGLRVRGQAQERHIPRYSSAGPSAAATSPSPGPVWAGADPGPRRICPRVPGRGNPRGAEEQPPAVLRAADVRGPAEGPALGAGSRAETQIPAQRHRSSSRGCEAAAPLLAPLGRAGPGAAWNQRCSMPGLACARPGPDPRSRSWGSASCRALGEPGREQTARLTRARAPGPTCAGPTRAPGVPQRELGPGRELPLCPSGSVRGQRPEQPVPARGTARRAASPQAARLFLARAGACGRGRRRKGRPAL